MTIPKAEVRSLTEFEEEGEALTFSYAIPGLSRFRVNTFKQRGETLDRLPRDPLRDPLVPDISGAGRVPASEVLVVTGRVAGPLQSWHILRTTRALSICSVD